MTGSAGQKRVPAGFLENLPIPLPPLSEQKRIVELLEKADRARRLRRYAREMSEGFLQSVFREMFGDCRDAEWRDLSEYLEMPLSNGLFEKNDRYGDGTPVVWVDDLYHTLEIETKGLRRARLDDKSIKKYSLQPDDILFTRSSLVREGIGYANIVPSTRELLTFECHTIRARFKADLILPRFAMHFLRSSIGRRQIMQKAKTATMTTISQEDIACIQMPKPARAQQERFVAVCLAVENQLKVQQEAERQAEHLFQTLLHRAFAEG